MKTSLLQHMSETILVFLSESSSDTYIGFRHKISLLKWDSK